MLQGSLLGVIGQLKLVLLFAMLIPGVIIQLEFLCVLVNALLYQQSGVMMDLEIKVLCFVNQCALFLITEKTTIELVFCIVRDSQLLILKHMLIMELVDALKFVPIQPTLIMLKEFACNSPANAL
jgi:hypothetical protein